MNKQSGDISALCRHTANQQGQGQQQLVGRKAQQKGQKQGAGEAQQGGDRVQIPGEHRQQRRPLHPEPGQSPDDRAGRSGHDDRPAQDPKSPVQQGAQQQPGQSWSAKGWQLWHDVHPLIVDYLKEVGVIA